MEELSDRETAGQAGGDRAAGGHRAQHRRRQLRQAPGRAGGHDAEDAPSSSSATRTTSCGDPLINHYHVAGPGPGHARRRSTPSADYAFKVNEILSALPAGPQHPSSSTSSWSSAACPTAPSCWPTRSAPTPAASGTATTGEKLDKDLLPPRPGRRRGRLPGSHEAPDGGMSG